MSISDPGLLRPVGVLTAHRPAIGLVGGIAARAPRMVWRSASASICRFAQPMALLVLRPSGFTRLSRLLPIVAWPRLPVELIYRRRGVQRAIWPSLLRRPAARRAAVERAVVERPTEAPETPEPLSQEPIGPAELAGGGWAASEAEAAASYVEGAPPSAAPPREAVETLGYESSGSEPSDEPSPLAAPRAASPLSVLRPLPRLTVRPASAMTRLAPQSRAASFLSSPLLPSRQRARAEVTSSPGRFERLLTTGQIARSVGILATSILAPGVLARRWGPLRDQPPLPQPPRRDEPVAYGRRRTDITGRGAGGITPRPVGPWHRKWQSASGPPGYGPPAQPVGGAMWPPHPALRLRASQGAPGRPLPRPPDLDLLDRAPSLSVGDEGTPSPEVRSEVAPRERPRWGLLPSAPLVRFLAGRPSMPRRAAQVEADAERSAAASWIITTAAGAVGGPIPRGKLAPIPRLLLQPIIPAVPLRLSLPGVQAGGGGLVPPRAAVRRSQRAAHGQLRPPTPVAGRISPSLAAEPPLAGRQAGSGVGAPTSPTPVFSEGPERRWQPEGRAAAPAGESLAPTPREDLLGASGSARDWPVLADLSRLARGIAPGGTAIGRVLRRLSPLAAERALVSFAALPSLGPGEPLAESTRRPLEAISRRDLSGVRVYSSPLAETLGARAFTSGQRIVFAPGRLRFESAPELALLGHEVAHVGEALAFKQASGVASDEGEEAAERQEAVVQRVVERGWPAPLERAVRRTGQPAPEPPPRVSRARHEALAPSASGADLAVSRAQGEGIDGDSEAIPEARFSVPRAESKASRSPVDVDALARKVYDILKSRLRAERERHGLFARA